MSKPSKLLFPGLIALCGLLAGSLTACSTSDAVDAPKADASTAAPAAIPVEVVRASRGEMVARYGGTATLEAEADAEVVARVGGEVTRLLVEEGSRVRAGQVLAVLDGRQLRLQTAQARAQLAKIERDYRRQVELHEKGLVAAGAFEGLKYDLDQQRATHDLAALQLSYTEIRAPFDGVVAERRVRLGQNLAAGAVAFRVTNPTPLRAQVFVPERELARLKPGQTASVMIDALGGRTFPARVTLVAPTIDTRTATFKVTLQVTDPKGELKPGMFARVGVVFARKSDALVIPRAALVDTESQPTVFIVENGKASARRIATGLTESGRVEVLSGLRGDEQVVVVGQNGLKSGHAVRIVALEPVAATRG